MGPVLPPAGATTISVVAVAPVIVAAAPVKETILSAIFVLKLVPVIITVVLGGPEAGLMLVTVTTGLTAFLVQPERPVKMIIDIRVVKLVVSMCLERIRVVVKRPGYSSH